MAVVELRQDESKDLTWPGAFTCTGCAEPCAPLLLGCSVYIELTQVPKVCASLGTARLDNMDAAVPYYGVRLASGFKFTQRSPAFASGVLRLKTCV